CGPQRRFPALQPDLSGGTTPCFRHSNVSPQLHGSLAVTVSRFSLAGLHRLSSGHAVEGVVDDGRLLQAARVVDGVLVRAVHVHRDQGDGRLLLSRGPRSPRRCGPTRSSRRWTTCSPRTWASARSSGTATTSSSSTTTATGCATPGWRSRSEPANFGCACPRSKPVCIAPPIRWPSSASSFGARGRACTYGYAARTS